jgi:lipopolysaccharide/colanic/teichoic acid biosynthesis glycosyltransferase
LVSQEEPLLGVLGTDIAISDVIMNVQRLFWRDAAVGTRNPVAVCAANGSEFHSEEFFGKVLHLEKRRSERSGKPFFLVLMELSPRCDAERKAGIIGKIAFVLATKTRDIDIKGWYRADSVIGLILPEPKDETRESLHARICAKVGQDLLPDEIAEVDFSTHVFPTGGCRRVDSEAVVDEAFCVESTSGKPGRRSALLAKRFLDVTGSVVGIALSLPVLLLVPLAIRLDSPGPIFFRQKRVGRGGKNFTFLKFRSMRVGNDPAIHREFVTRLIHGEDPNAEKGQQGVFKIQDDPRVTRVGKFIRKTSLDELPQFFNVFLGDMSLVGPRPPIPYEVDSYDLWHKRRVTEVKPGITGLWQVEGRSSTTFADMVRLDLRYIREWSLWLDIKILLLTPKSVIAGKGAV